jgi:hypothetical protein
MGRLKEESRKGRNQIKLAQSGIMPFTNLARFLSADGTDDRR